MPRSTLAKKYDNLKKRRLPVKSAKKPALAPIIPIDGRRYFLDMADPTGPWLVDAAFREQWAGITSLVAYEDITRQPFAAKLPDLDGLEFALPSLDGEAVRL